MLNVLKTNYCKWQITAYDIADIDLNGTFHMKLDYYTKYQYRCEIFDMVSAKVKGGGIWAPVLQNALCSLPLFQLLHILRQ